MPNDDKKARILAAAIELFACNGYAASNVPSVAKKADVSVGTIYHYFKNKQEILNVALRTTLLNFSSSLSDIFQKNSSIKEMYDAVFTVSSEFIRNNTTAVQFLYGNIFNPDLDEESIQIRKATTNLIMNFLKKGQTAGTFIKSDVCTQMSLLIGSLSMIGNFYWISKNVQDVKVPDNADIRNLKNQVWNGLTNSQTTF